jgi:hypothetical protein
MEWYCCPCKHILTLILLTWRIWWARNNASKWQMGFNSVFKGVNIAYSGWMWTVLNRFPRISNRCATTGCGSTLWEK